jgi:hypothetical protein
MKKGPAFAGPFWCDRGISPFRVISPNRRNFGQNGVTASERRCHTISPDFTISLETAIISQLGSAQRSETPRRMRRNAGRRRE